MDFLFRPGKTVVLILAGKDDTPLDNLRTTGSLCSIRSFAPYRGLEPARLQGCCLEKSTSNLSLLSEAVGTLADHKGRRGKRLLVLQLKGLCLERKGAPVHDPTYRSHPVLGDERGSCT